jgi:hypothetical protein
MLLSKLAIIYFIVCSQAVPVRPARAALLDNHESYLYTTQQEDRRRSVYMEATLNGPSGRTVLGPAEITIGRLSSNQVMVNDPKASSRHATIRQAGQSYSITDLGSTNGTFVNEQKLSPNTSYTLNPGDRIRIGDTTFTYEVAGAPAIAPTVYGGAAQGQGYDPTVAAASPYSQYEASPPPAYQPPPDYQVPPAQQAYNVPPAPYAPYGSSGQPAYGAPAPAVPGAVAPAGRRNNRTLWTILAIVGGVVVLGIIACVVVLAVVANSSSPTKTLDTFCSALNGRDYQTAYNQLSPGFQQRGGTEASFASSFAFVSTCSHDTPTQSGDVATSNATFLGSGQSATGKVTLIKDSNGNWKINDLVATNPPQ